MFYRYICGLAMLVVSSNAWSAMLQDNGDGTVTDTDSSLTWQQVDDDARRDWKDAQSYCDALSLGGKSDWRLPTPRELTSIVVYQASPPTIDEVMFPSTNSSGYWTVSSMDGNSWNAWYVDFYYGPVDFSRKTQSHFVRCIRGG